MRGHGRMVPTSYATPRGPGGVLGVSPTILDELAGFFVRGSWSASPGGGLVLKGVIVRRAQPGENMGVFETAESWTRARCGEGNQVFIAAPSASELLGGVGTEDRALLATSDASVVSAVTATNWISGANVAPMELVPCPSAKLPPKTDDTAVRSALIAGSVVAGTWVIALGLHFLTKKK